MICLETNPSTGALQAMNPQPSDLSSCSLVAGSYSELVPEILMLTPEQGAQIGAAIWLVWAIVWGFKMIAKALYFSDSDEKETS